MTANNGKKETKQEAAGAADARRGAALSENEKGLPPYTNRGVTVTVHWLSITYFTNPIYATGHFLKNFLGYELETPEDWSAYFYTRDHGARGYRALWIGPEGIRLYGYPHTGVHCHLEIPGEVIEHYGPEHALHYLCSLERSKIEWRLTRVDIAFDHVPFTPAMCHSAWLAGNVRTKAHKDSWRWWENGEGRTFYAGSRKSGRVIRVYDRRGPTRLEIEFKGDWADVVGKHLATMPLQHWMWNVMGILRDFVEFVDALNVKNIARAPLLSWWGEFVAGSEKAGLSKPETDAKRREAIRLQAYIRRLLPTLYIYRHAFALSLDEIVDKYRIELTLSHWEKLRRIKKTREGKS